MLLSVIIVNYNVKYFLGICLKSVEKAVAGVEAEIIVIDNASVDGSLDYLKPKFPLVKFVENKQNIGFGKANNQGLSISKGKYILFLNPDTIVAEDSLTDCLFFIDTTAKAGACGVRMIDGSGRFLPESKRGFPAPMTAFYKLSGLAAMFPRTRLFAKYYLGHLPEKEKNEVDVLAGAFFLTSKKVLDEIGAFDEQFFMYGEDVDLSYRIQQAGYKNFYNPSTTIIHFKGESTKKGSLDYIRLFYRAMSIFVKKHYGKNKSKWFSFAIRLGIWVRALPAALDIFLNTEKVPKKNVDLNTFILGTEADAKKIRELLEKDIEQARSFKVISNLKQLGKPIGLHKINEMIFSEKFLSYKDIIEQIQLLPRHISKKVFDAEIMVIIGSDSKNKSGTVVI